MARTYHIIMTGSPKEYNIKSNYQEETHEKDHGLDVTKSTERKRTRLAVNKRTPKI